MKIRASGEQQRLSPSATVEPEVLRMDFYNSLLAAFEPDEIQEQLSSEGLSCLSVRCVSDRHLVISGRMPVEQCVF